MRKVKANMVKRTNGKDAEGNTTETYEAIGSIWCNYILPMTVYQNTEKDGFHSSSMHETYTSDTVENNRYLRTDTGLFHIVRVLAYPSHLKLEMEKIDEV